MKTKRFLYFILLFILTFSLTACSAAHGGAVKNKAVIAVSIVPQSTFVKEVCGDKFEVLTMIPAGASPETYEPAPQDIAKLEAAEIYFSIGVPAEEKIISSLSKTTVLSKLHTEVSKVYPDIIEENGRDPHIWLSPKRVAVMINSIAETLTEYDPENKDFYKANAEKYIQKLSSVENEITETLKAKTQREFLAFHPAFGYFAEDFALTMHCLEEHGKEATAKHIAEMTDLAKEKGIKTIFYQAETSGRQAKAFAEEIDGKAVALEPLSADYIENLRKMTQLISEAIS